jgi:hypothetical protein
MKLFKNKRKNWLQSGQNNFLVGKLQSAVISRQTKIAAWLNRKTQHWNRASKLIALLLFCCLFGGCSLYLLIRAIF